MTDWPRFDVADVGKSGDDLDVEPAEDLTVESDDRATVDRSPDGKAIPVEEQDHPSVDLSGGAEVDLSGASTTIR
jgi:hypothetical protein